MYKAGLVGTTGYTGMEIARLLANHPRIELAMVTARQDHGAKLESLYPFLRGFPSGALTLQEISAQTLVHTCHVVFLAVPHGVAMKQAAAILHAAKDANKIVKVVDLSADFRIKDSTIFEEWYNVPHTEPAYLKEAVYGLIEIYEHEIQNASLVANPGCYPTASLLGLYPAIKANLIDTNSIIIDAKSGTTGAGRKAQISTLFCEVSDSFKAYSIGGVHRHTPEIEQELSFFAGTNIRVSFNPHLLPIQRGILTTIYSTLKTDADINTIQKIYEDTWKHSPFIRVLPKGQLPETRHVRGSMFCDIAVTLDTRTNRLIVTSAIDNLARGASAQAIANANLMLGLPVQEGLFIPPIS